MKTESSGVHLIWLLFVTATFVLSGCGGGGSNTPAAVTLGGVAAVGSPIINATINVSCAKGGALSTTTNNSGAWQVTLAGQTLPCAVQVSGGTINTVANTTPYHTIATAPGTVNATPLTDLMVANLAGAANPSIWFAGLNATPAPLTDITQANVDASLSKLRTALSGLTPLGTINPITTAFTPTAGNVSDDMLVALKTSMTSTGVTHTSLLSNASASVFIAPVAGFNTALTSAYTGTTSGAVPRFDVASLTFASQENFTTSAAQTVTLSNTGNTGIVISNHTVTFPMYAKFIPTNTTCPVAPSIFAAGASCTFSINFTPAGDDNVRNVYVLNQSLGLNPALPPPESHSGVLDVYSNSVTNPKVSVHLNGTGVYPASSSSTPPTASMPTVTGMSPTSGTVGTTVTITGTNFSTTPANNTVKFNGTQATITVATTTSLTVTVPSGATTGKVSVATAGGTATSAGSFTITSGAGSWTVTTGTSNNNCGAPADPPYSITISQNGNSLTAVTPVGTFSGSISGNTFSWSGSYPDQGGTTTINSLHATLSGNSFSGTSSWTWDDGFGTSCSGTDTFTGSR